MVNVGKNLIEGLWEGIKSMGGWLKDKVTGFGSGIVGGFKSAFGINSPSRVMKIEVGQWIPPGIGEGIEMAEDEALRPLANLKAKMSNEISLMAAPMVSQEFSSMLMVPMAQATPASLPPQLVQQGPSTIVVKGPDTMEVTDVDGALIGTMKLVSTETAIEVVNDQ